MNEIKVSIITVCFNSEKTIERTIKSVLEQTYKNIEYLIIDGASTDKTMDIVNRYREDFGERLKVLSEKDEGIYFAMNKGIDLSTGELIGIINSDDWYEKDAVEKIVRVYMQSSKAQNCIIHGITYAFSDEKLKFQARLYPQELKKRGMGSHPSCFVNKQVYNHIGKFREKYRHVADYDFMIRAYDSGDVEFLNSESHIANAQLGGVSSSSAAYKELLRLKLEYGIISRNYMMQEVFKTNVSVLFERMGFKPIRIKKKNE